MYLPPSLHPSATLPPPAFPLFRGTAIWKQYLRPVFQERNIILALTHEYRQPPLATVEQRASEMDRQGEKGNVKVDMLKRFVGLVVVPGRYVNRIEVEG